MRIQRPDRGRSPRAVKVMPAAARLEALEARRLFVSVGPDGFGYVAFDHPFESVNLVPGGAGVVNVMDGEDDDAVSIPLGANTFRFYGTNYTGAGQLYVSTNGLITFGSGEVEWDNTDLTAVPAQRAIAPLWDDWQTNEGTSSAILYKFETNRLIIEWNEVPNFSSSDLTPATFQAILQLNPAAGAQSEIILNYPDLDVANSALNDGASATVGIKDAGAQGANRLLVAQDNGSGEFVASGKAVRIVRDLTIGSIAGDVFADANNNGVKDGGEGGLPNWTVYLDADNDAALDPGERSTTTDGSGNYLFGGVSAGSYNVRQVVQAGYASSAPPGGVHAINLAAGQNLTGVRFGARPLPAEIRGTKWHDLNGNRSRDAGEPGLSGWTIYLDNDRDGALDAGEPTAVTNGSGEYAFTNLLAGTYVVAEVHQPGWVQTYPGLAGAGAIQAPQGAQLQPPLANANAAGQSDVVAAALARAADLSRYTPTELESATEWVVGLKAGRNVRNLNAALRSKGSVALAGLTRAHVLQFDAATAPGVAAKLKARGDVAYYYPLVARQQSTRAFTSNDPLFANQWHLKNTGQTGGTAGADANVQPAWTNDFTGDANTVIGVVDDGLQHTHPDLTANYQSANSFDFNFNDSDPAPGPGDSHGTAVAGVAAGRGGNVIGVTGAAPLAGLAGLRLVAARTVDQQEADALSYHPQNIDIYSNSWGPEDDAARLAGPGPLTLAAMASGVTTGRGGLGSIYTWAAGNGLGDNDNANYDGYANSRYVIAVSAIDHTGDQSFYSEPGAPILVAAYSDNFTVGITTTDLTGSAGYSSNDYTSEFGGTSSATPLVSGVVALMLDANPNLTWRDVQHILVRSARKNDPSDLGWRLNGAGHDVSHKYGFGAIDAGAAVAMAQTWQTVAPEVNATSGVVNVNTAVPDNNATGVTSSATINDAIHVESVEVVFNATHAYRGDLRVVLTSPSGTQSVLAEVHDDNGDEDGDNYRSWVFSSKQHWDEQSRGTWTLKVTDENGNAIAGTFDNWKLNVYGTQADATVHYVTVASGEVRTGVDFGNRDAAAPTADVIDVTPDPRTTSVNSIDIVFSEPVTGVTVSDLTLTRNGGGNLIPTLPSSPSLTSSDGGITWTLSGIGPITGPAGNYVLTLTAAGSGIVDVAGNALATDASDAWTVTAGDATPPTVTTVFVAGSSWAAGFRSFLATSGVGDATFGYRLDAANHADELPWTNVNRFSIRFSENVTVGADDLVLRGVNAASYTLSGFTYDAATFTATWGVVLAAELRDKLLLDLDADLGTGVTDAAGNALDGEWTNPASSPSTPGGADTFPSGNGTAGGDFRFRVNVLPGDVNRSGTTVNAGDVTQVRNRQFTDPSNLGTAPNTYTALHDVNGNATINAQDVTLTRNRQFTDLPAGEPAVPASFVADDGAAAAAPREALPPFSTTGIPDDEKETLASLVTALADAGTKRA